MSLLSLRHVCVREGRREVLSDVSLEIEAGELVALSGAVRAGKSTVLGVAAGLISPDAGTVLFDGQADVGRFRGRVDGMQLARERFNPAMGPTLIDQVAAPRIAGTSPKRAESEAFAMMRRTGTLYLAAKPASASLDFSERMRIAIARALITKPRLLLVDEPTAGIAGDDRDAIVELLRSLPADGATVLITTTSVRGLGGWRHLTIDERTVRGVGPQPAADVVQLHRRDSGA